MKIFNLKKVSLRGGILVSSSFFISKNKRLINSSISIITILTLIGGIYYNTNKVQGVDFTFSQTNWSMGETPDSANHTNDQIGWNQYSTKDTNISIGNDLSLSRTSSSANINFNTENDYIQQDAASGTDFSGGMAQLHGSGSSGIGTGGVITYTDSDGLNPRTSPAYAGGHVVHTFTSNGIFVPAVSGNVDYLVVAGGGGGGSSVGGGGGGGGFRAGSEYVLINGNSYVVNVGGGGIGLSSYSSSPAGSGQNSAFGTIISIGGGGGGGNNGGSAVIGGSGGSGGGGGNNGATGTIGGSGTSEQGNNGGGSNAYSGCTGGGGGGSSAAGQSNTSLAGGNGGSGAVSDISGVAIVYAGGGGAGAGNYGGNFTAGSGGSGGGGNGSHTTATAATNGSVNTGGGGGGGGYHNGALPGANGGSGIVIVRYPMPTAYPIDPYYVTTASGSQLNTLAWSQISGIDVDQVAPANTDIKYFISFDNRSTWKYWNGSIWQTSNLVNIETDGMDKSMIESVDQSQWNAANGFMPGTLDIAASLSTTDAAVTPILDNITINYVEDYSSSQALTSSPYNTELPASNISSIQWSETLPENTDIRFQLRTSPDGTNWESWCGPDNSIDGTCDSSTYFTDPAGNESIDDIQRDRADDQFIQYKVFLISTDGQSTPILEDVSMTYATVSPPAVSTDPVSNITAVSALGNANIINTGGENPERFIEWGTQSNIYIDQCSANIGLSGSYSCNLTDLQPETAYFVRAKATNSEGTTYGEELSFTTLPDTVTIINPDGTKMDNTISSNYASLTSGTITATPQVSINTNLKIQDSIFNITFPQATQITNTDTGNFNFQNFIAQNVSTTVRQEIPNSLAAIKVGVPDTKLTFSQPATLSIDINSSYNNRTLDVFYQNDGETEWHSQTSCTITAGQCIFQTNHATTYSVNGSGNMVGDTGINLNTDIQEVISLNCGGTTVNLGNITPGSPVTGNSICTTTTNANGGYALSVKKDNTQETLQKDTEPATTIPDKTPWDPTANANSGNADTWSGTGLGFTVYSSSASKNTDWWGTGADLTDTNNKYAGFATDQSNIMIYNDYSETSTQTSIGYKLDVPPTQKSGAYSGNITYQAVTAP
jgi:hypothetical protein